MRNIYESEVFKKLAKDVVDCVPWGKQPQIMSDIYAVLSEHSKIHFELTEKLTLGDK